MPNSVLAPVPCALFMPLLLCLFWLKASAAPFSGAPVPFYAAAVPYYALLCALTAEG